MSIAPVVTQSTYSPSGTTLGPFGAGWTFEQISDLGVYLDTGAGAVKLTLTTDYTVTAPDPVNSGGFINLQSSVLAAAGGSWPAGTRVTIVRGTVGDQPSTFGEAAGFSPASSEDALDHVERQVQDLLTAKGRAVLVDFGDQGMILPRASTMKGRLLGADPSTGLIVPVGPVLATGPGQFVATDGSGKIILRAGTGGTIGPEGPTGPVGPAGPTGPVGPSGGAGSGVASGLLFLDNYVPSSAMADCSAGIANAVTALHAQGGGKIVAGTRTYLMNTAVNITQDNITIEGQGPGATIFAAGATGAGCFTWNGGGNGTFGALAQDVVPFTQFVYPLSLSGWSFGDIFWLYLNTTRGGAFFLAAYVLLVDTAHGRLVLDRAIPFAVNHLTDSYEISGIGGSGWVTGGGLRSLTLNGFSNTNPAAQGLGGTFMTRQVFRDIRYEGFGSPTGTGSRTATSANFVFDVDYDGLHDVYQCGSVNIAAFMPANHSGCRFGRIKAYEGPGFGPQWQWCTHCEIGSVESYRMANRGMKVQGCRNMRFGSIKSQYHGSTAFGISYDSAYNFFDSVDIEHTGEVVGNSVGLWFSDQGSIKNHFNQVRSYGANDFEVAWFASDQFNRIEYLQYDGNVTLILDVSGTNIINSRQTIP